MITYVKAIKGKQWALTNINKQTTDWIVPCLKSTVQDMVCTCFVKSFSTYFGLFYKF